jgi:hypothetical protein
MLWRTNLRRPHIVPALATIVALVLVLAVIDVRIFGGRLHEWFKPQPILTFAGVIAGFLVLRWQLAIQHQNAMHANAEKDRNQLYLEIYRDIAQQSEQTTRALQDYGAVGLRVHMAATLATLPTPPAFPQPDEVRALWSAATAEVIALMGKLEKWEIAIGPGVMNFKRAFADCRETLTGRMENLLSALADVHVLGPGAGSLGPFFVLRAVLPRPAMRAPAPVSRSRTRKSGPEIGSWAFSVQAAGQATAQA